MKPAPFIYHAPRDLPSALDLMAEHGYDAKLLAGGQSLIPVMNFRLAQPTVVVDLNPVDGLSGLAEGADGTLHIGAMVRQSTLERSPLIRDRAPLMYETMPHIAHPQIRNRGTIGGSLAHADPAGELPVLSVALEATFRLARAGGERLVRAEAFYQGLFTTDLAPEEILTEIHLPPLPPRSGWAFLEEARRHGDYAQAGIAAVIELTAGGVVQQARLVFLNAGDIPMQARQAADLLIGQRPTADQIETAAHHAAAHEIDPGADVHASAPFKRHLAAVLARRALTRAVARAEQSLINGDG